MKLLTPSSSNHTVVLPDGTSAIYHLRSLRETSSMASANDNDGSDDHAERQQQQHCHNQDDIANWTKFCASVFSYKPDPPPPSYFARHFYNDPRRDASLVRVLVHRLHHHDGDDENEDCDGEIASSVRIFRRTLSIPGHNNNGELTMRYMDAGGIGEVCTSIDHRRRGLSSILLEDAIQIMKSLSSSSSSPYSSSTKAKEQIMSCSLLHASPDFRPVYSKVGGYVSVKSEWSVVPIRWKSLMMKTKTITTMLSTEEGGGDCTYIVRHAQFPNDAHQLQQLHMEYSEKRLITISRSEEYWKEYVSAELGDTLWVLSMKQSKSNTAEAHPAGTTATTAESPEDDGGENTIVAWMSLRKRGDRFQLREFGADNKSTDCKPITTTTLAMKYLLPVALDQAGVSSSPANGDIVSLVLPSFVLSEMKQDMTTRIDIDDGIDTDWEFLDFDSATDENDDGWMYLQIDHSQPSVVDLTTCDTDPIPHLIWPTDSF